MPNLAASDAPNSLVFLMQEVDELSVVEHKFTTVVLSDADFETVCGGESVISSANFMASPLSVFLKLTDLTDQLHPACSHLFACLQHLHSHKKASTSAVVVLPKHPGVWLKCSRNAQLLQDLPCSNALFVAAADETLHKRPVQVYYTSPVPTGSLCAVVGASGLTMQFHGTVSNAPVVLTMDSISSHTLMSVSHARRMKIAVEPSVRPLLQVAVANGMVRTSLGICRVCPKLQEFIADLRCHVIPLADAYEVILGDDWLSKYSATLSWAHQYCVLT